MNEIVKCDVCNVNPATTNIQTLAIEWSIDEDGRFCTDAEAEVLGDPIESEYFCDEHHPSVTDCEIEGDDPVLEAVKRGDPDAIALVEKVHSLLNDVGCIVETKKEVQ